MENECGKITLYLKVYGVFSEHSSVYPLCSNAVPRGDTPKTEPF